MAIDSSGKLLHDALMKLPNMTEDVADSIVDWIDSDTDPRPSGAENDYYSGLSPGYRCKNGPLDSVDELLLIKGVTKELLFGADTNRNGMQDPDEMASDGAFDRGWSAFLTVYSHEQNRDATGQAYVYVNGPIQDVYDRLSPETGDDLAKFLIIYRQYGASTSNTGRGTVAGSLSSYTPDTSKKGSTKINSLFDLVNVQVAIPGQTQGAPTVIYASPLNDPATQKDLMPKLFAKASLVEETEIPGRVNVNTAPREVLMALPSLNEGDVQNILSLRPKASSTDAPSDVYQTPTWLLTEANIPLATLRQLDKYVTTRTQVYRVQSVGYFDGKGPAARVEAVIDANGGRPRILAWRDLSELGRGWNPK
jgi:DNA uptake protein ComE-like DNA-binding protein